VNGLALFTTVMLGAHTFYEPSHETHLRLIHLKDSPWTRKHISQNIELASEVFSQCGVKLIIDEIETVRQVPGVVTFDLEGYEDPNEPHEENSALDMAQKYNRPNVTTVYFLESFDPLSGNISATAVPPMRVKHPDQKPALNSVWMTYKSEVLRNAKPSEGGINPGYNILAHELGHVLLNTDHVIEHYVHNLMHEQSQNRNGRLTIEQCERVRNSPLVQKIKSQPRTCAQAPSGLRDRVVFLNKTTEDCSRFSQMIEHLEKVHDAVSDLHPVMGIDFYLRGPSNTLQFLDRHAFEASLRPTYDQLGRIPLPKDQKEVLWAHELGHAILNAQLAQDWPWYKKRNQIMRRWKNAVMESTQLENSHGDPHRIDELSRFIKIQIKEVGALPHAKEFESMLAYYHEFFADSVAVIYKMDPLAVKKALANPEDLLGLNATPEELKELEERDYSYLRNVQTWNTSETHAVMTPTLAHVWQLIAPLKPTEKSKQEIVRRLYQSILEEILERTKDPKLRTLTVPEINRRMIQRLSWF
jgi:hypothetical protein